MSRCKRFIVLQAILQDPDVTDKGSNFEAVRHFFGNGLVSADAAKAKRERKALNPGFNRQLFHGFLEVFNNESRRLVDILSAKFKDPCSPKSIKDELFKCTLEIVFRKCIFVRS